VQELAMLQTVDLSLTLDPEEYNTSLIKYQVALFKLGYQVYVQQRPVIMIFEGWDAPARRIAGRENTRAVSLPTGA
jgi:polyphosphate kinase 2 (PPK2 family)